MSETSTTAADDLQADATPPASTTSTDSKATDNQTADTGNDLDTTSKSTDTTSADDDKSKTDASADNDAPASFDSDLDDWIAKRNLAAPETDEQRQAYQDLRNDRREHTRENQAKKDLTDTIDALKDEVITDADDADDEDDPLEKRIKAMEADRDRERNTRLQSEFWIEKKVTDVQGKEIMAILKEKIARPTTQEGKIKALEVWSHPDALPDLLDLAKARLAGAETSTVADEVARETREQIAQESQAKSPGRNASHTTTSDKTEDQERYERFKARYNK